MSKAVLISIRPKWCQKIASGEKTIEVRKTRPNLETPFKCYIYRTKGTVPHIINDKWWQMKVGGTVIGEFTCDRIYKIDKDSVDFIFTCDHGGYPVYKKAAEECCGLCVAMPDNEFFDYLGHRQAYGWHISDLKIYDTPKELGEFWFPPEKYCEKELCGDCPYDQVADVNGEYEFDCEWRRPLNRPPQSWCYVEEQK